MNTKAPAMHFVTCLDGKGKIMIDGKPYFLEKGESIVMPANHPHAVYGEEDFKMMLVVVFPSAVRDRKKPDPPSYTAIFSRLFQNTRAGSSRISVEKKGDFFCGKPSFQFQEVSGGEYLVCVSNSSTRIEVCKLFKRYSRGSFNVMNHMFLFSSL